MSQPAAPAPTAPPTPRAPAGSRSGSTTRQRTKMLRARVTSEEYAQAEAAANGQPVGTWLRALALGVPVSRERRRRTAETAALGALVAQLGKVGSNLNQMSRRLNERRAVPPAELAATVAQVRAAVAAVMERLGRDY